MDDDNKSLSPEARTNTGFLKEVVLLFIILLVSCAAMYCIIAPAYQKTKIVKAGNKIKKENIKQDNLLLAKIIRINSENKKFDSEMIKKIKDFIPNRNSYEDHLAHIFKLANNKNIKVNNFSIHKNEEGLKIKDGFLKEMKIDFKASSGFPNLMGFLKSIEKGIPFIQEESIIIAVDEEKISGDVEINADSILDYEIKLKFYYY
jgi:hypothetical protein